MGAADQKFEVYVYNTSMVLDCRPIASGFARLAASRVAAAPANGGNAGDGGQPRLELVLTRPIRIVQPPTTAAKR